MNRILLFLFALCLLSSCKKDYTAKDDFSGSGTLSGLLQYSDSLTGNGQPQPLANRKLYIAYHPSDTLNYMYSVTTDTQGYFVFQHLATPDIKSDIKYDLFFLDTVNGVKYIAYASVTPERNNLVLTAVRDMRQANALFITTKTTDGNTLPQVSLCLFNNRALALADTACSGSIYQATTDMYGRYIWNNIPAGKYYLRAGYTAGGVQYKGFDTVIVTDHIVSPNIITLTPVPVITTPVTGFELNVYDNTGSPVNGSNTCVFTNQAYFAADTCIGNVFTLTTDIYGKARQVNINPGIYYLRTVATFNGIQHKSMDTVTVIKDTVVIKPIHLP